MPVTEQELTDFNKPNRDILDKVLKEEFEQLKYTHAQLGLSFNIYPTKNTLLDLQGVFENSEV